jgi:hypothetical protein
MSIFSVLFFALVFFARTVESRVIFYFTQPGCSGCAISDPVVLAAWLRDIDDLVVVEYDINQPGNLEVLRAHADHIPLASVPMVFLGGAHDAKNYIIGGIDIKNARKQVEALREDGSESLLLAGSPRVWSRNHMLMKKDKDVKLDVARAVSVVRKEDVSKYL